MEVTLDKLSKDNYLFLAKTADQTERYDDMFTYAEKLVLVGPTLTLEERNLFCSATKIVIDRLRRSRSVILNDNTSDVALPSKKQFTARIEGDIINFSRRVLKILENHLIPSANKDEKSTVFYLTMKGDFYRYEAEVMGGGERGPAAVRAKDAYVAAEKIAKDFLPTDAIRLGVVLSFSAFYFEIANDKERAVRMLKEALKKANVDESKHEEETALGLMKENLASWKKVLSIDASYKKQHGLGAFIKRPFDRLVRYYKRESKPSATPLEVPFISL